MAEDAIPRRSFLKGAGAAGAAAATVLTGTSEAAQAQVPAQVPSQVPAQAAAPATGEAYLTLTATEAAFLSAAYDTFIPADKMSPSGTDCGLVTYIDRQLAGAWGKGARFYRNGPFLQGKPEQRSTAADAARISPPASRRPTPDPQTPGKDFDRLRLQATPRLRP